MGSKDTTGRDRQVSRLTRFWSTHDRTYRIVIALLRTVFRIFAIRFDIRGTENIPTTGAGILASNHIGFLDFAFVGLAAVPSRRKVRFMAKRGVFRNPVSGPLMRAMRHIPVDRASGSAALRQAMVLLKAGELVGIFPEATISRAWTLKPFQAGAAALAVSQQVPLIPVITWGGHRLMTVDGHHSARRHLPVSVWAGEPIQPDPTWVAARGQARVNVVNQVEVELRNRMQDMLDRAQREYPERPRNPADSWWLPRHLGGTAPDPVQAAVIDAAKMLD